ncbi:MAG: S41 family peptidase, partial [Proteobacteria bacterium]|nr:S41 family peptidase [Pseudomonadota bacterium]
MVLYKSFLQVCLIIGLYCLFLPIQSLAQERKNKLLDQEIELFEEFSTLYNILHQYHLQPLSKKDLIKKAINGMTKDIDPYTHLMSREELENLEDESMGKYRGVGISTQSLNHQIVVTQVYENSPAALSGILPGDVITHIDDHDLKGASIEKLHAITKSTKKTTLQITSFHPEAEEQRRTVTLNRNWLQIRSTRKYNPSPGLLIIQLQHFQKNTPDEVSEIMTHFKGQKVILDLRNNPGGLLLAAVETAELFLSEGLIVETRDKNNQLINRYVSRSRKDNKPELLILINRYTASAAEILAGALKDRNRAVLFGEKSFGKGVVQSIYPVSKNLFLKMSTAKYFLPSGMEIQNIGIPPHFIIED